MIMKVVGKAARVLLVVVICIGVPSARAENVDPAADGSRYVYGENVGWINAEPLGEEGPGLQVDDFELTGWLWGEGIGWISMSCKNTASCDSVDYGVTQDGDGSLTGFAWAESAGWISFAPAAVGVTIDLATGAFAGRAWGENIGWITFASSGTHPFALVCGWNCDPAPAPPADAPWLTLDRSGEVRLNWSASGDGTGYDVLQVTSARCDRVAAISDRPGLRAWRRG